MNRQPNHRRHGRQLRLDRQHQLPKPRHHRCDTCALPRHTWWDKVREAVVSVGGEVCEGDEGMSDVNPGNDTDIYSVPWAA